MTDDNFLFDNGLYATGGTGLAFLALIFVFALGLRLYARAMYARGVLG